MGNVVELKPQPRPVVQAHLILYHKHPTSARTRFLLLGHGGVCGPAGLPADAAIDADMGADGASAVLSHPGMLLRDAEVALGLSRGSLEADSGFRCRVGSADAVGDVHLAHFTSIDPPFAAAESVGARFIDLTQARGLPAPELMLLRRAYEHVLG